MIICVGGGLIICEVEWGSGGVTPSANRNSFRVAISFYILTQGRGASPATLGWGNATPTELLLEWNCYGFGDGANKSNQSPNLSSITIINHKPIGNLASIIIINPKPIGTPTSITSTNHKSITLPRIRHNYQPQTNHRPRIHHKHQPQTNLPTSHPSQASTHKPITNLASITIITPQTNRRIYIHP